jgi:DNA-binding transcriptional MerR regulator
LGHIRARQKPSVVADVCGFAGFCCPAKKGLNLTQRQLVESAGMKTPSQDKRTAWRIGELADAVGLTVRTLRHYEQAGLLPAPRRSEGGHRLYAADALQRLQYIRSLRGLGLTLVTIKQVIRSEVDLGAILAPQLAKVEQECERWLALRATLRSILGDMATIVQQAKQRAAASVGESPWRALGEQLRALMEQGVPPSADEVQAVAQGVAARIEAFAGGDATVLKALANLRRAAPPPELAGWTPELMRYLDQALGHRHGN